MLDIEGVIWWRNLFHKKYLQEKSVLKFPEFSIWKILFAFLQKKTNFMVIVTKEKCFYFESYIDGNLLKKIKI